MKPEMAAPVVKRLAMHVSALNFHRSPSRDPYGMKIRQGFAQGFEVVDEIDANRGFVAMQVRGSRALLDGMLIGCVPLPS